jgi:hypothetical protein
MTGAYPRVEQLKGALLALALLANIRLGWKVLPEISDKHSSLLEPSVSFEEKSFITLALGVNPIKLFWHKFTLVIS